MTIKIIEEGLFVILPVLDNEQEEIGFGQGGHVIETAHARSGNVSDQNAALVRPEHTGVHRVAHSVLNAAILVLK